MVPALAALMLLVLTAPLAGPLRAETAKVMDFARADPAMNAATEAARASLPEFLAKAAVTDLTTGDYRVKWAHPTDQGDAAREHIWVVLTSVGAQGVKGVLSGQPRTFRGASGDPVGFAQSEISDWMFFRADGLIEGGYTTRVMLGRMSAADREGYEAQLAPLPVRGPDVKTTAGN